MKNHLIYQQNIYKQFAYLILILALCFPMIAFSEDDDAAEEEAIYFELSPPFVVNLKDTGKRIRFLQARIQVLAYGKENIELVKTHDAPIRDTLITLLSSKSRKDINTSKKKKALQEEALESVKKILKSETGKDQIEGLYFTNFVVQ